MKKDYILNNVQQIKNILYEIKKEEDTCNEGAMTDKIFKEIIELLINIEKERLMQIVFWEE